MYGEGLNEMHNISVVPWVGLVTVHDIALCGVGLIIGVQDVMG